jgi:hypothetical protein
VRPRAAASLSADEAIIPIRTAPSPPSSPQLAAITDQANSKAQAQARPERHPKTTPKPHKSQKVDPPPIKVARTILPIVSREIAPVVTPAVIPVAAAVLPPATLEIEVDHNFTEAHLSLWVDDKLTYTRVLKGTDKKRLGMFHHVEGHFIHALQVPAGKHRLRVRVTSDLDPGAPPPAATPPATTTGTTTAAPPGVTAAAATEAHVAADTAATKLPAYDQSSFMDGDFTSGKESVLQITFRHGDINLSLE